MIMTWVCLQTFQLREQQIDGPCFECEEKCTVKRTCSEYWGRIRNPEYRQVFFQGLHLNAESIMRSFWPLFAFFEHKHSCAYLNANPSFSLVFCCSINPWDWYFLLNQHAWTRQHCRSGILDVLDFVTGSDLLKVHKNPKHEPLIEVPQLGFGWYSCTWLQAICRSFSETKRFNHI